MNKAKQNKTSVRQDVPTVGRRIGCIIKILRYHNRHDFPDSRINALHNITMKAGVRPVTCAFCPAMFNRIPLHIIDMPAKVILVT